MHITGSHDGPCPHMEGLLNQQLDGKLTGLGKWYALSHMAKCPRCREYFEALKSAISKLRIHRNEELSHPVLDRLADKLSEISKQRKDL